MITKMEIIPLIMKDRKLIEVQFRQHFFNEFLTYTHAMEIICVSHALGESCNNRGLKYTLNSRKINEMLKHAIKHFSGSRDIGNGKRKLSLKFTAAFSLPSN